MGLIELIVRVGKFYDQIVDSVVRIFEPWLVPTLVRLVLCGVLLIYYWSSGLTKLGDGFLGLFSPSLGAYVQMFPAAMESAGYDPSQLGFHYTIIALFGMWSEFILPALIALGLFTRLAAIGMIGFVFVQSYVDVFGHHLSEKDIGTWFDTASGSLLVDQRSFWVLLLVILVIRGAGPISLDAWFNFILKPNRE